MYALKYVISYVVAGDTLCLTKQEIFMAIFISMHSSFHSFVIKRIKPMQLKPLSSEEKLQLSRLKSQTFLKSQ